MEATREERKQVAKAIMELYLFYKNLGEENTAMAISLDDLARMAGLEKKNTEQTVAEFINEKLIKTERSAISILKKGKLTSIANE